MPYIRILALAVLQIFCSQSCSYIVEKGAYLKNDKTVGGKKNMGPLIFHVHATYKISRILFTRLFLYKMPVSVKRAVTQPKIYRIGSKVDHFIYTLVCNYTPNIRIQAKAVLQIFCSQGCSYTKCLCPKKGNNLTENLRNRFKS